MKKTTPLPCPFCGETPEIESKGSCIDIICCCCMGIQKSDYLSSDAQKTWNAETLRYSDDIEVFLNDTIVEKWNTRVG